MAFVKKNKVKKWAILIVLLFGPGLLLIIFSKGKQKINMLPRMAKIKNFEFIKFDGDTLNNDSIINKIIIFTTIQPSCPDTCGIQINQISELIYEPIYNNRSKHKNVKIISIVTNHKGEKVSDSLKIKYLLNHFVRNYSAELWTPVFGNPKQIYDLNINGKNLFHQTSELSMSKKLFPNSLILVDKSGNIRSLRIGKGEAQVRDFASELRSLIGEYKTKKSE